MTSLIRHHLKRLLARLSLIGLAVFGANAQTADDFFHGGAQSYLSNNIPNALAVVTNGLQRFPDDAKLKKLYELLNQKQQQQNQQDQKQDQQKDQKQDQQKQDQQQDDKKDQQSKNEQQKKDEAKKQQDAQKKKDQDKKDQQQAKSGDKSKEKPGEQQPVQAHAMTPQEAKQLLDAQKDDEQVLLFQPKADPQKQSKQLKDW